MKGRIATLLVAFLLAVSACSTSLAPAATPNGTLPYPAAPSAYHAFAEQIPAWIDRSFCTPRYPPALSTAAPDAIAGLECLGGAEDIFSLVTYNQQSDSRELLTGGESLTDYFRRLGAPDLALAPSCLEGPWQGLWDINGEIVGRLTCYPYQRELRFEWTDVRAGIVAWASFREGIDYPTAYRFWRMQLTDIKIRPNQ